MLKYFKYISDILKKKPAKLRSSEWRKVRNDHLKIEPICQWCGGKRKLEVHHIEPFHENVSRELDPTNLITLCEAKGLMCHLHKGHNGNFRDINANIREDCFNHQKELKNKENK